MIYRIRHITRYTYEQPVSQCFNKAHLLPRNTPSQRCLDSRIEVTPKTGWLREHLDYFGNRYCYFMLQEPPQAARNRHHQPHRRESGTAGESALDLGCSIREARARIDLAADEEDPAGARIPAGFAHDPRQQTTA